MRERNRLRGLLDRAEELLARREPAEPGEERGRRDPDDGGDSVWDRMNARASIAPVQGDPGIEPANEPWEAAMMTGWGDVDGEGRGHDALEGVDSMVLGDVDATQELRADSATMGTPLELGPEEDPDVLVAPAPEELSYEDPHGRGDWCTHL